MGDLTLFLKTLCGTHCAGIAFSRGTSWLIQLAGQFRLFDAMALIAPYPPPGDDDRVSAERLCANMNCLNIIVVGSETDECACTEAAHPEFWRYLHDRGLRPWINGCAGHGVQQKKNFPLCCQTPDLSYCDPQGLRPLPRYTEMYI